MSSAHGRTRKRNLDFEIPLVLVDPSAKRIKAAIIEYHAKKKRNSIAAGTVTPLRNIDAIVATEDSAKVAGSLDSTNASPGSVVTEESTIDSPTSTTTLPTKKKQTRSNTETESRPDSPVNASSHPISISNDATVGTHQPAPKVSPFPVSAVATNQSKEPKESPIPSLSPRDLTKSSTPVVDPVTEPVTVQVVGQASAAGPETPMDNETLVQEERPASKNPNHPADEGRHKTENRSGAERGVLMDVDPTKDTENENRGERPFAEQQALAMDVVLGQEEEVTLAGEVSQDNNFATDNAKEPSATPPTTLAYQQDHATPMAVCDVKPYAAPLGGHGEQETRGENVEQRSAVRQTSVEPATVLNAIPRPTPDTEAKQQLSHSKPVFRDEHSHSNAVDNATGSIRVKRAGTEQQKTVEVEGNRPVLADTSHVRPPVSVTAIADTRSSTLDQGMDMSPPLSEHIRRNEQKFAAEGNGGVMLAEERIDDQDTETQRPHNLFPQRIIQFIFLPILLAAAIAWVFPRTIPLSGSVLLELENVPKLTLRDVLLDDQQGFHLAMAPAFFGFYGYFGALAAWYEFLGSQSPPIRSVTGASAGAMAAVLIAAGIDPKTAADFCATVTLDQFADFPGYGALFKGEKFEEMMHTFLVEQGKTAPMMEDAVIPVTVSAYDLRTFRGKILRSGPMAKAARSSATFPLLFQPVGWKNSTHEFTFIDGGIADMYGLLGLKETMNKTAANRVVNLSVGAFVGSTPPGPATFSESKFDAVEVISLSLEGLPQPGPLALDNGPLAYAAARDAMRRALDTPLQPVVEHGRQRVRRDHYILAINAA